jgi:hypothetical protein
MERPSDFSWQRAEVPYTAKSVFIIASTDYRQAD